VNRPQRDVPSLPQNCLPNLLRYGSSKEGALPSVLIVDDYAAVRSAIRVGLERHPGFSVCGEAVGGVDAIEKATRLHPDFVLLDLSMPGIDGVQTACALKSAIPQVRIVVFTLYAELLGKTVPAALGIDAVIDKLQGVKRVVECIRNLLGVVAT
jgi:two-component system response regulator DevR